MTIPVQVTFKDMEPSPALEARIREKAARLERFEGDILRCIVTVEAPHRHHHQGRMYRLRVEVVVPRGDIVVTREGSQNHAHEDAYVAVRDAFDAVVRQLEDHVRGLRGQTKHHEVPLLHGRVTSLIADQGYGFVETSSGQEVYFHRNSVVENGYDRLRVGDEVRMAVTEGEKGWQASTVHRVGKHHPVERD
ncbi:MAG: HPF/RaiA family ribosome-associated protein [Rhodospirillales bacterium]|nr:HPF/RaiA family ribosome-associated protein [Rhodospirillales bacterium]